MDGIRRVIACALVAVVALGTLTPHALAQQPAPPPAVIVEVQEPQTVRGTDVYDVSAGVVTAARIPLNVAVCALGTAAGITLFMLTLGSAYRATVRTFEEGCGQRWVIHGDDIRPHGLPGIFPQRVPAAGYSR